MQIRNLLTYLGERNVTTVLVSVQHGLLGAVDTPAGYISYLADTVVLLRYYEHQGEVRRALSVFKRRAGDHERTIRDIGFASTGISVGPPLRQFRGVLTGVPEFQQEVELGMTSAPGATELERRVVILPPSAADGAVALQVLRAAAVEAALCATTQELCATAEAGAAVLVLAEEALVGAGLPVPVRLPRATAGLVGHPAGRADHAPP